MEDLGTDVWPDNMESVNLYIAMLTQRRENGGFDYSALPAVLDLVGFESERRKLFEDFRTMEDELLTIMAEKREADKANRR